MNTSWRHAFDVRRSSAVPSIAVIGVMLVALFLLWLYTAQSIYTGLFGDQPPASIGGFIRDVLTTSKGWTLILAGNAAGVCLRRSCAGHHRGCLPAAARP